jgi:hypothetical protein
MQKAKKEDFRVEEELRSQKAKYEESSEDVYRRMEDIKAAEVDSVADLTAFLEAELSYYDNCREVLTKLKRNWPAQRYVPNIPHTVKPPDMALNSANCKIRIPIRRGQHANTLLAAKPATPANPPAPAPTPPTPTTSATTPPTTNPSPNRA